MSYGSYSYGSSSYGGGGDADLFISISDSVFITEFIFLFDEFDIAVVYDLISILENVDGTYVISYLNLLVAEQRGVKIF